MRGFHLFILFRDRVSLCRSDKCGNTLSSNTQVFMKTILNIRMSLTTLNSLTYIVC
jgi:hypothetical protein